MNIVKKYWDSVYIYVLLLVPGLCMAAGILWTSWKMLGLYQNLEWMQIIIFDCTHLVYMIISIFYIYKNKKNPSYISEHLVYVKGFVVLSLFIQYNYILYLFPSDFVWECTFIFFGLITFLFDSKIMFTNICMYFISVLFAHIIMPEKFLVLTATNLAESIVWRLLMFLLISLCMMVSVIFVEKVLMQVRESNEENVHLIAKQLEHYKAMELMDTEIRKFRHDITNHFICMEAMLNYGKTEELKQYFRDLQLEFSTRNNMYFSGNDVVDTILNHDLPHNCREEVNVTIYGNLPEIRTVSAIDLCTLFSNLLSNAINASNQCVEDCESKLEISFSGGNRYFSIKISNSVLAQDISQKKKDRNHGYGLNKIKNVLEKYDGRFEQNVENEMFSITVYLPI